MVFQKRLTHFLVWVTCDSLLRKRMVLHSHTHQPIKCKHAFFKYPQVKLWNDTCLQKSPRGGEGFTFWPTDYKIYVRNYVKLAEPTKNATIMLADCWPINESLLPPLTTIPEKENNGRKRPSPTPSVSNLSLRPCRYLSIVTRSSSQDSVDGFGRERLQRFANFDSLSVQRRLEAR